MVRAADLVNLPGLKKAPKKRIAAILEPSDDDTGENNEAAAAAAEESDEENASDAEELEGTAVSEKLQKELQSLNKKGVQVQLDLKDSGKTSAKKAPAGRGKGVSGATEKKSSTARGSGAATKRKR